MTRPFKQYSDLVDLKYNTLESGVSLEFFHASEDSQKTRNDVFSIIQNNLHSYKIYSVIIEKRKTIPQLQIEEKFFLKTLEVLLKYIFKGLDLKIYQQIIIVTDKIPVKKKREAIEKGIKQNLSSVLEKKISYQIHHHDSKSNFNLQIADYCCWAIYRKWDKSDLRSYDLISESIINEFDLFEVGSKFYY